MNNTLDPIIKLQTKIIFDFENTVYAGRKSVLTLKSEDLKHSLDFFKDKMEEQTIFRKYLRDLFRRTLRFFSNEKTFVQEDHIEYWRKFLKIRRKYKYINMCIDEETGDIVCQLEKTKNCQ